MTASCRFSKTRQIDNFWHFLIYFYPLKCKHSSLRSQFKWDLFCNFQTPWELRTIVRIRNGVTGLYLFLVKTDQHLCFISMLQGQRPWKTSRKSRKKSRDFCTACHKIACVCDWEMASKLFFVHCEKNPGVVKNDDVLCLFQIQSSVWKFAKVERFGPFFPFWNIYREKSGVCIRFFRWVLKMNCCTRPRPMLHCCTMFENYSKCRIWILNFVIFHQF